MLLVKEFDANAFARLIERERVTTFYAATMMLVGLLKSLDRTPRDVSSLDIITTTATDSSTGLAYLVRDKLGCQLLPLA